MPKTKASWNGYPIFQVIEVRDGWAKISFYCNWYESPWTGTGCSWVDMNEIVVEEA